jgi:predicted DCC family thiol-disulfide oxidoreductase YuxK
MNPTAETLGSGRLDPEAGVRAVVLFDGTCNFCDSTVQRLIAHDPHRRLRYGTLQSERGQHLRRTFSIGDDVDSMIVIAEGSALVYSDAALAIGRALGGMAGVLARLGLVIPRPLRNAAYRAMAKRRYRWFGQKESCMVPTPDVRSLFLPEN